jgi:hypothetical protein
MEIEKITIPLEAYENMKEGIDKIKFFGEEKPILKNII